MILLGVSAASDGPASENFFLAAAVLMLPASLFWWFGGGLVLVSVHDAGGPWAALVFAVAFALAVAIGNALVWLELGRVARTRFRK